MSVVDETLDLLDGLYEPTKRAIEHRRRLVLASDAPEVELSYYAAQLSLMLTLLEHLTDSKTLAEMREHTFRATVAFTIALGLMNHALGILTDDTKGVVH